MCLQLHKDIGCQSQGVGGTGGGWSTAVTRKARDTHVCKRSRRYQETGWLLWFSGGFPSGWCADNGGKNEWVPRLPDDHVGMVTTGLCSEAMNEWVTCDRSKSMHCQPLTKGMQPIVFCQMCYRMILWANYFGSWLYGPIRQTYHPEPCLGKTI